MYIARVNISVYFNKLHLQIFISSVPAELALQLTELLNKDRVLLTSKFTPRSAWKRYELLPTGGLIMLSALCY